MNHLARIADRVINRPLLLHPQKAEVILYVLGDRVGAGDYRPSPEANRFIGQPKVNGRSRLYNMVDGAAVITIEGSLVNRGAWIGTDSGLVSYEGIEAQLTAAVADADVKAIVLDIDSPGGEATGMYSLAAKVRTARDAKPVVALVNDLAASAAYGIASQADEIVISPTSVVGSIGVVLVHMDYSGAYKQKGIKPTLIYAGAHKVDGHPFGPLPDSVQEDLQREVMTFYDRFVEVVAGGRGDRLTEAAARATEARTFIGQDAIEMGLADHFGGLAEAIAAATAHAASERNAGATTAGRPGQTETQPAPVAGPDMEKTMDWKDLTIQGLREHRPDLVSTIETAVDITPKLAAAKAEGEAAGAVAERARILGIEKIAPPGHTALVAEMKSDGTTSPEKAAMRLLEAENAARAARMQGVKDAEKGLESLAPSVDAAGDPPAKPKATTPEGWKAEWEASEDLRAEFTSADSYVAYKDATQRGVARIKSNAA